MIGKAFHFIHGRLARAARWLGRSLSEGDGSPSSKRLFFGWAIFATTAFCAYDVIKHGAITREVIELMSTVIYVTAAAYGVTHVLSTKKEDPAIAAGTSETPRV